MDRRRVAIDIVTAAAVVLLGAFGWWQQGRITELDDEVALLRAEVDAKRDNAVRAAAEGPKSGTVGVPDVAASVANPPIVPNDAAPTPHGVAAETVAMLNTDDPAVRSKLRDVIDEARQEERSERHQQRLQRREERLRERTRAFADKHTLDTDTEARLTDMLVVEQLEVFDLFRAAREDFSFPEAREKADEVRGQTDEKVRDLLDDEQYADYLEQRQEEAQNWRGPRGRGGPPAP